MLVEPLTLKLTHAVTDRIEWVAKDRCTMYRTLFPHHETEQCTMLGAVVCIE